MTRLLAWAAVSAVASISIVRAEGLGDVRAEALMPPEAFDRVVAATIARQRSNFDEARAHWKDRPPQRRDQVDAVGIGGANTLTALALAKASVSGSVDGTEAGVSVSPFPLLGWDTGPHQARITLAALRDGVTRLALGYAHQPVWEPANYDDLGLSPCPFDAKAEKALGDKLEANRAAFRRVCEVLVAAIPAPPSTADPHDVVGYQDSRHACGLPGEGRPDLTLGNAVANFVQAVKRAALRLDPPARDALDARADAVKPQLDQLRVFDLPLAAECHKDEIADSYARMDFERAQLRWGLGAQVDLFPITWGYNPDPFTPLTHGEPSTWLVRAELSWQTGRGQFVADLGSGESRTTPRETLHLVLSPALSFAWIVGAIGRDPLYKDGVVRVQDGAVVSHVSAGLIASVSYAPNPPSTQKSKCEAVNMTAFLDFVFTADLSVRLGVPVTAKLVGTKEGIVPKTSDLQWSVPAYVAMILKK
jgi:hypothetical protein